VPAAVALAGWLQGGELPSTHLTLRHATLDAGGGGAVSAHYRLVSSLGGAGGVAESDDSQIVNRQGFPGLLNDPPLPAADTVRPAPGQPLKVRVASLLANDRDPEADRLALRGFDAVSVAGGQLIFDNGWLVYEPPPAFLGTDSFTYTLEDAAGNLARALVTVLVVETGPVPSQNLIALTVLPGGHTLITFAGIARRRYAIEGAATLPAGPWERLATVEADARGVIEWVDATEPAPPERYYRTVAE
jgi:hypothetical protein